MRKKEVKMINKNGNLKIIIAGGGTGGHIFPAVAIANALKQINPQTEILFVGAKGKMEMEKIPEAGYEIKGIDIMGYNRDSIFKNWSLPFKLIKSHFQVVDILKTFKPDAVIGVGGYSTFPVLRLAQTRKIPTFIHEANSLGGKSNSLLSKRAKIVFVAHDGMEKYFASTKILNEGNPVREIIWEKKSREEALQFFGMQPQYKTIFVMGGSLGARSINETIQENIGFFKKNKCQLIWQTGKNFSQQAASVEEENHFVWSNAFITHMENAYAAADIIISRAGAMTIAELCAVGKPAILVPYPFAAEDHQTTNALSLVNKNAALMVPDSEVKNLLMPTLLSLMEDNNRCEELSNNIVHLAKKDVAKKIAKKILEEISQ